MGDKFDWKDDVQENLHLRWKLDPDEGEAIFRERTAERFGYMLGISLGLGCLFCEERDPEVKWLRYNRDVFGGKTAIEMMKGEVKDLIVVSNEVLRHRGF